MARRRRSRCLLKLLLLILARESRWLVFLEVQTESNSTFQPLLPFSSLCCHSAKLGLHLNRTNPRTTSPSPPSPNNYPTTANEPPLSLPDLFPPNPPPSPLRLPPHTSNYPCLRMNPRGHPLKSQSPSSSPNPPPLRRAPPPNLVAGRPPRLQLPPPRPRLRRRNKATSSKER